MKSVPRKVQTAGIVAGVVFALTLAMAQSGGLTVKVTDQDGLALPGATVTLGSEVGYIKTTSELTNTDGVVVFPVLRPGQGYWIEVSFPTFALQRHEDLRVSIGGNETLKIALFPEIEERIKVEAESDVIDLEASEQSTKFSEQFIADLPVAGRSYTNVIAMAPGVQDGDGDGNPNVHGSRNRDFSAMVGGVRNVDPLTGQRMSEVNINTIEEMEVITAGAGLEFGRAQGGFANIVQKQGSNEHEGVFEMYLRTSKLDGAGANDTSNVGDPDFETYQPSLTLSGPILRDKLWYSLSAQYFHLDEPRDIATSVVVVPTRQWSHSDRITWQVSPRNKLTFALQADPYRNENRGVDRTTPIESTSTLERSSETYSIMWTAPFSSKILVDSTVAWQDLSVDLLPTQLGVPNDCVTGQQPFLARALCQDLQTGEITGSYNAIYHDQRQRLTASGQATIFAGEFWGASHTFRTGIGVENERYFRQQTLNPTVAYVEISVPPEDGSEDEELRPLIFAFASVPVPQTDASRVTGTNWSIFAEDAFKPRQNLTVNLGLRVDREEINGEGHQVINPAAELNGYEAAYNPVALMGGTPDPNLWTEHFTGYENLDAFSNELVDLICEGAPLETIGQCEQLANTTINSQVFNDVDFTRRAEDREIYNTNFSPRIAIAWSPWSNGKTAFRGTARRYYNLTALTMPLLELDPDTAAISFDNRGCEPGMPCVLDPSQGVTPAVTVTPIDPNYRTAYQDEFTFTIDRELWAETSIHFDYVNRKYRDQPQDRNINLATGDKGWCVQQTGPAGGQGNNHPWIALSPGAGQELTDFTTGGTYIDTDPGFGDGRIDDCVGQVTSFTVGGKGGGGIGNPQPGDSIDLQRPDGRPDLYVQNPLWGDIFLIGNFNQIDYEAYQVRLIRRQYRSWEMNGSYTWSEAIGDGEDFNQALGDDPSLDNAVHGYQSYDQRHVVKLNATTITPWGIRLGSFLTWQSGYPYSVTLLQRRFDTMPPSVLDSGLLNNPQSRARTWYPSDVRNDQRNPSWWNLDLRASKELNLGRGLNMQVSAEVFNVFDDGTYFVRNVDAEVGFNQNGIDVTAGRRFGRRWQLGMKLSW